MGYWVPIPGPASATLGMIAVGSASQVWGLSTSGGVPYQYVNGEWIQQPGGSNFSTIIATGAVWAANDSGVYYWSGTGWQSIGLPPNASGIAAMAAGPWPSTYVLDSGHSLWQISVEDNNWVFISPTVPTPLPAVLAGIAVGADQRLVLVTVDGSVYVNNGSWMPWGEPLGPPSSIAAYDLYNIVVVADGVANCLSFASSGQWSQMADPVFGGTTPNLASLAIGADGTTWAIDASDGTLYYYLPDAPLVITGFSVLGGNLVAGGGSADLSLTIYNNAPNTVASNIVVTLTVPDAPVGLTIPSTITIAGPLEYGQSTGGVQFSPATLTAQTTADTPSGTYTIVPTVSATLQLLTPTIPVVTGTTSDGTIVAGMLDVTISA